MTKKDLVRRNRFLLLQLKEIQKLVDFDYLDYDELMSNVGHIQYLSSPECIKENISFLEEYDLPFDFFHEPMDISDYE